MAQQLAKAGVLQDGDIALTFRLDGEYVGQFNTLHFAGGTTAAGDTDAGTDALHILRPAGFDAARRTQLQKWASTVAKNRAFGKVKFQKDYLTPIFASKRMTTTQIVTQLGKIILGQGTMDLPMYCSEFAWHMLALSSCSEAEITSAGPEGPLVSILSVPAAQRADLVAQIFTPEATAGASPRVTARSPSRSRRSCPASRSTTAPAPTARRQP